MALILEDKLKKRQDKDRQKALAKAHQVKFSQAADDIDSENSSFNSDALEESVLNEVIAYSIGTNLKINMANPELAAKLKSISIAELEVKQTIEDFPP